MTKKFFGLLMASCALSTSLVAVHEIRTPLTLLSKLDNINGAFHYPLTRVEPVLFKNTSFNIWAGAYYRNAFNAYCPKNCGCSCSCDTACDCINPNYNFCGSQCMVPCQPCCGQPSICGSDALGYGYRANNIGCFNCPDGKTPLASLFFGKAQFTGSEAFGAGTNFQGYEYLQSVIMKPQIEYKESGIVVGMHAERKVEDKNWRVAFNADLPIKCIEVTRNYDCDYPYEQTIAVNAISSPFATCDNTSTPTCVGTEALTGLIVDKAYILHYPEEFFNDFCVRLYDKQNTVGIGDLDTALVIGYDFNERAYLEAVGGVLFPTAKTNKNSGRVYYIPAGNNGHFETKIGFDGGWRSKTWVGIQSDIAYHSVLSATEKKAAQFNCATIRGIGPCIDAKVKYGYFLGHLNMTIFHPEHKDMGLALGYEVYYKRQDKTAFATCNGADRAKDFLSNVKPINPMMVMLNTDVLAHKIRGQVFTRWDYFELYAGGSKVVGGFNCMAENELHVGFDINF